MHPSTLELGGVCNWAAFFVFADIEAPHITCSGDQSVKADKDRPTAMLTWRTPTTSDNSGHVSDVFCNPQSGTNFTIGETVVVCEAVDGSGNTAECSFQINIAGDYRITLIMLLFFFCLCKSIIRLIKVT